MIPNRRTFLVVFLGTLFLGLFVGGYGHAQSKKERPFVLSNFHPEFIESNSKVVFLKYSAYDAGYSVKDVQPAWVGYRLRQSDVGGSAERASGFQREPRLAGRDAEDRDYAGSGYDKGHLAPAADMAWSPRAMSESFSYANVSPQRPGFNRGIWKRLETQVRDWAAVLPQEDSLGLLIWSGPVLNGQDLRVGRLRIAEAFYKVVYHPEEARVAALLLPHSSSKASLEGYLVSVDSLEKVTGLNFLVGLPDNLEERLESEVCGPCWTWTTQVNSSSRKSSNGGSAGSSAVICSGNTKAGKPCRNMTRDPSGLCHHHR